MWESRFEYLVESHIYNYVSSLKHEATAVIMVSFSAIITVLMLSLVGIILFTYDYLNWSVHWDMKVATVVVCSGIILGGIGLIDYASIKFNNPKNRP